MNWQPVRAVTPPSPRDCWDRLQHPPATPPECGRSGCRKGNKKFRLLKKCEYWRALTRASGCTKTQRIVESDTSAALRRPRPRRLKRPECLLAVWALSRELKEGRWDGCNEGTERRKTDLKECDGRSKLCFDVSDCPLKSWNLSSAPLRPDALGLRSRGSCAPGRRSAGQSRAGGHLPEGASLGCGAADRPPLLLPRGRHRGAANVSGRS